jgi:hypothetical protein
MNGFTIMTSDAACSIYYRGKYIGGVPSCDHKVTKVYDVEINSEYDKNCLIGLLQGVGIKEEA